MSTPGESRTDWQIARREMVAPRAAVAAKHPRVAEIGLGVLRDGGNAVDAAVAMSFAIGVAEPFMNGLAGSGFMTIAPAAGEPVVVDYFGRAPRAAHERMYEVVGGGRKDALGVRGVVDDANLIGHRAVAVPGMPAGMALALERFGSRDWRSTVEPSIALAEEGLQADWHFTVVSSHSLALLNRFAASAEIFTDGGLPHATEDLARPRRVPQKDLARTLRRIADQGPREFYEGETAQLIARDMAENGGLIDQQDLAGYTAQWLAPLAATYRGHDLLALPAGSGGPTAVATLKILEGFDLAALGHNSADALHLVTEASRLAFADRYAFMGDEAFLDVPWDELLATQYLSQRRALIDPRRAMQRVEAGDLPRSVARSNGSRGLEGCTTYFGAVDEARTVVSCTQTLTGLWGSGVTAPGSGVLLNNAMNLFDPLPDAPNSVQPGKRPLSNMSHFVTRRGGRQFLSAGAPGGRRIIGTVMQTVMNVLDFSMDAQSACSGPYIDCSGPELWASERLGATVLEDLAARGHAVAVAPQTFWPMPFASPMALLVDSDNVLHGGADPWYVGIAAGY